MAFILKNLKKILILLIGLTIILIGIALLVLPGPGIVTIIVGLGVLSLEFVWAKRLFKKAKVYGKDQFEHIQKKLDQKKLDQKKLDKQEDSLKE